MSEWLNRMLWGNPNGYSGIPTLYEQRRQLGQRMGMPSQGTMGIGRGAERSAPMGDLTAIRQAMAEEEARRNAPLMTDTMGIPNPMPAPAPTPAPNPAQLAGPMSAARQQEIAYANQPQNPAGSMGAARQQEIAFANSQRPAGGRTQFPANVPLPPERPKDTPALYYADFGDGSPMRAYLSKDGKAPDLPGAAVFKDDSYDPNAGFLQKFIRGVF